VGLLDRLFGVRGDARDHALGHGVWRRTYDDCANGVRRIEAYDVLDGAQRAVLGRAFGTVRDLCQEGQRLSPSDTLDAPSGEARSTYDLARRLERELREVEYRSALVAYGDIAQRGLLERVLSRFGEPG